MQSLTVLCNKLFIQKL